MKRYVQLPNEFNGLLGTQTFLQEFNGIIQIGDRLYASEFLFKYPQEAKRQYDLYNKAGTGNRTSNNMSWSVYFIGTPAAIVTALHKESNRLTGDSKEEFDKAKPHLIALVESNFNTNQVNTAYKLEAAGHVST